VVGRSRSLADRPARPPTENGARSRLMQLSTKAVHAAPPPTADHLPANAQPAPMILALADDVAAEFCVRVGRPGTRSCRVGTQDQIRLVERVNQRYLREAGVVCLRRSARVRSGAAESAAAWL
jgi:hypothetical protein